MTAFELETLRRLTRIERELVRINTSRAEVELLTAIAEATAGTLFTASELVTHANAIPSLRAALGSALGTSAVARRLGKALSRLEGASAFTIERCGTEGNAILWKVCLRKLNLPVETTAAIADDAASTARIANG